VTDQVPGRSGESSGWRATHQVTAGMRVWTEPDPQLQPIAAFQEATEVRVEEERGAWARIVRADGWGGWVDGRRLEVLRDRAAPLASEPVPPPPPPAPPGTPEMAVAPGLASVRRHAVLALGAALTLLSCFLPWGKAGATNAFRFELSILWDTETFGNGGITTGVTLVILAAVGLAAAALSRRGAVLGSLAGVLVALIGVVFFSQMVGDAGSAARAFSDVIGFAPYLTVIGGLIMVLGGLRRT
jgi:hypothetical protein